MKLQKIVRDRKNKIQKTRRRRKFFNSLLTEYKNFGQPENILTIMQQQ